MKTVYYLQSEWTMFIITYLMGCVLVYLSGWIYKRHKSKNRSVILLIAGAGLTLISVNYLFQGMSSDNLKIFATLLLSLPMIIIIRLTSEKLTKEYNKY